MQEFIIPQFKDINTSMGFTSPCKGFAVEIVPETIEGTQLGCTSGYVGCFAMQSLNNVAYGIGTVVPDNVRLF